MTVLLLGAGGCKQARKEPAPTAHVTPEYQRASEAIDKQIPNTPGLPGSAGVNGIKKALQANEAARIAAMCRSLGQSVVMSESFAELCPPHRQESLVALGRHTLRGVARAQMLFGLAPAAGLRR